MATAQNWRFLTLLQREFREYKNSLFWTPVITASVLGILMLGSVVLVNKVGVIGDTILEAMMREGNNSVNISISLNEDGDKEFTVLEVDREEAGIPAPPVPDVPPAYRVIVEEGAPQEPWNFSQEWTFNPDTGPRVDDDDDSGMNGRELNVLLSVVHGILLLILIATTVNYLLSSLYDDRKDRSILFWRSMPVSERDVVLSKFVTAIVVAPLIYVAISLLLQLAYVLLMMMLVWRMDQDPFEVVVANIDFVSLMLDPISGWVMTALLIAPTYAWLLCASALAKRSPFLMAITPVIALFVLEAIFLGSEVWGTAVQNHLPHLSDSSAVGFYLFGPDWMQVNWLSAGSGLLFAVAALAATVWLRRHRWELN
jgi:hypothetical protein